MRFPDCLPAFVPQPFLLATRLRLNRLFEGAGCALRLHNLKVSDEVCKARIRQRNEDGKHEFAVSEEQFDHFTSHFVPPSNEEWIDVILQRH